MSGGHFDYRQYLIDDVAQDVENLIARNGRRDADDNSDDDVERYYPPDIIDRFKEAAHNLRRAAEMAQRVDWYLSGDDGEDSFRERWAKEVRAPWPGERKS